MGYRGPIVCATDLSEAADEALGQACALGTTWGLPVTVCHVLPEAVGVRMLFPHEAGVDTSVALADKATAAVRARLETILGAESPSPAIEIDTGSAHAGILRIAERLAAGLIVVGPGSTAARVARSAGVAVLVARPSPTGGAVLGATDFSDPSLPAVTMAVDEAGRRGVRLRVIHCLNIDEAAIVAEAGFPGVAPAWPLPASLVHQLEASARERLDAALAEAGGLAEPLVARSAPATGILDAAHSVATALIVVGTRGRTGLARLALGSTAEAVMGRAPCSVLVVPLAPA